MKFDDATQLSAPDGVYPAMLTRIVQKPSQHGGMYRRWTFVVQLPGYADGVSLTGATSLNSSQRSKARQWASTILGREIRGGEDVDENEMFYRDCQVKITTNDRGYLDIIDVLPADTNGHMTLPPASATPDGTDDIPF